MLLIDVFLIAISLVIGFSLSNVLALPIDRSILETRSAENWSTPQERDLSIYSTFEKTIGWIGKENELTRKGIDSFWEREARPGAEKYASIACSRRAAQPQIGDR